MSKPGGSVVHGYGLTIFLRQPLRCFYLAVALWLYVGVALGADINAAPAGDAATAQFSTLPLSAISSLYPYLKDSTTSTSTTGVISSVGPAGSTAGSSVPDNGGAGGSLSTEANIGLGLGIGIGIPLITVLCFFLWRGGADRTRVRGNAKDSQLTPTSSRSAP
ncbi:hypothetical protein PG996_007358 [Apiospora saccharicola]|uniref:Uncharacterized protein n=1 Tax=Apiospora saccharicola TaxID=335842 RepID=A0ABR1VAP0_9PEZI